MISKQAARRKVAYAISRGRMTKQPCEACGNPKAQAHHDDYARPLDVRWLCTRCHTVQHQQHGTPPGEETLVRVSLWLPKEWREPVTAMAKAEGKSINSILTGLFAQRFGLTSESKEG